MGLGWVVSECLVGCGGSDWKNGFDEFCSHFSHFSEWNNSVGIFGVNVSV